MIRTITAAGARLRVLVNRFLMRLGFGPESFLLVLAVLIGMVTAAAAVGFHELIDVIRTFLYGRLGPKLDLYGRGIYWLVIFPAAGGLIVGVFNRYFVRVREGRGILDVMESVMRSSGVIKPDIAFEKIITSAVTIGTGGSTGAEGPIVQIGAAIASGIGQFFRVTRQHMPVLIGCGSAAGISAIFNAPIGGVLFTLEVILRDFSIRAFTPVVIASVIANFTMQMIFSQYLGERFRAIFTLPQIGGEMEFRFGQLGGFAVLGIVCGLTGVVLTRVVQAAEEHLPKVKVPSAIRPALGGAAVGLLGVIYIIVISWWTLGKSKFIAFDDYAMPAFFGDGYGAVKQLLTANFYESVSWGLLLTILATLIVMKVIATALTLGSGGSGGIIAPSLFVGAMTGGIVGMVLKSMGLSGDLDPHIFALVGMAAVLAAVVHAPLAAILILFELTGKYSITLPAMLSAILATTIAQVIFRDSIYTAGLRSRGLQIGTSADLSLLRRISVEQIDLEPASTVRLEDGFQRVLDLTASTHASDFVAIDARHNYAGMVTAEDIKTALIDREAAPLLVVREVVRTDLPLIKITDDLAMVVETFARHDVNRLAVCIGGGSERVVGVISRAALMKRYQMLLSDK